MAKIQLSETIHFQPSTEMSAAPSSTSESTLKISIDSDLISPGNTISAHVHYIFADDAITPTASQLDYLTVSLEGQILANETPTPFVHAAEVEHEKTITSQTHFVLPFSIRVPDNAHTNGVEATWKLSARAVWQNTQVAQDQVVLHVARPIKTRDAM